MPEIHRATETCGKTNTQTTATLMTLTNLREGPFGAIRQILPQINNKSNALREAYFRSEEGKIEIERLRATGDALDAVLADKKSAELESGRVSVEAAIKEIGMYQQLYAQICKSHNIPPDWDEATLEAAEIENHIKQAFKQAHRDILNHGTIGLGNAEYLEQYGIHLHTATGLIKDYIKQCDDIRASGRMVTIDHLYDFIDAMAAQFKDAHKSCLRRLGVSEIIKQDWLYLEQKQ
jgi:hypothetical protein